MMPPHWQWNNCTQARYGSSERCKDNPFLVIELEEWCKDNVLVEDDFSDNDYQVEDDCLDNEVDCLEDDCLIDDENCLDDEVSQLEDDHEDTEVENYLSEGSTESDKLSDAPDISYEIISSEVNNMFILLIKRRWLIRLWELVPQMK